MDERAGNAGFTLLEVLVAGTVAVILLVALLRAFGNVWDLNARVREDAEAMIVARAVLEAASNRDGLGVRSQDGRAGTYDWSVAVEQAPVEEQAPRRPAGRIRLGASAEEERETERQAPKWQLYRIRVAVRAPSGRRTFLDSLKLGPLVQ